MSDAVFCFIIAGLIILAELFDTCLISQLTSMVALACANGAPVHKIHARLEPC